MRAFVIHELGQGGAIEERPSPQPGPGEVLVRVKAVSLNAMDPIIASGAYRTMMEHRLPLVPGLDASGTVEAVGPDVTTWQVGDEVFGRPMRPYFGEGTLAEEVAIGAATLARKPEALSHEQAAALPTAGTTALSLVDAVAPKAGETVAVLGAGGGVGSFVVELAARAGARVLAVSRTANAERMRALGAAELIDYEAGDVAAALRALAPEGAEAIIDLHGDKDSLAALLPNVKAGGRVTSALNAVDVEALAAQGLQGSNAGSDLSRLAELGELAASGQLTVPISRTYPLDDTAAAMAEQATRQAPGKIVVRVD